MLRLIHLSDPHVGADAAAGSRLARVIEHINNLRDVNAVLITGDLTASGAAGQRMEMLMAAQTEVPLLTVRGNHDAEQVTEKAVDRAVDLPGARLLLLDSSVPGAEQGHLDEAQVAWIQEQLATHDSPTLLAMHHPPVGLHARIESVLDNPDPLRQVVERHRHVVAILAGHLHTAGMTTWAGVPVIVAPSTWIPAPLCEEQDRMEEPEMGEPEPSFIIHYLDGDILTSQVRTLEARSPRA